MPEEGNEADIPVIGAAADGAGASSGCFLVARGFLAGCFPFVSSVLRLLLLLFPTLTALRGPTPVPGAAR